MAAVIESPRGHLPKQPRQVKRGFAECFNSKSEQDSLVATTTYLQQHRRLVRACFFTLSE